MWSQLNYRFVLALLFFEVVASVPHPPTYLENYKLSEPSSENKESFYYKNHPNFEQLSAVHKLGNTNQAAQLQERDRDYYHPRSLPAYMSPTPTKKESKQINNAVDEIFPRQIITNSFRTPRAVQSSNGFPSTVDEIQAASPVIHEINIQPTFNRETSAIRESERSNQFQNERFEKDSYENPTSTKHERDFVKSSRDLTERSTDLSRPSKENQNPFQVRREHDRLPLIDAGHVAYNVPVSLVPSKLIKAQIANHADQKFKPIVNEPLPVSDKDNVQELLSSQRIRDVLSTTKHRKRYLVIHPNGTVEHIDNLEPIAKNHPNYVLVTSRMVPNSIKTENVVQSPIIASTAQTKSTSINTEVVFEPQLHIEPVEHHDADVKTPPKNILTEPPLNQLSSVQEASVEPVTETETASVPQVSVISENVTTPEENVKITEVIPSVEVLSKEENTAIPTENILTEPPLTQLSSIQEASVEPVTETETASVPQVSVISENVTTPEENVKITEVIPSVEVLSKEENTAIPIEILNSSSAANIAVTNTWDIEEPGSKQKAPGIEPMANASLGHDNLNEQNEQLIENFQGKDLLKHTEIMDEDLSGKPAFWFNTSDPNFWNMLTDDQENNTIYIFNINSRPRIEKDTIRTILSDGSILEEITESIWYNEDDPVPVVTKTSSIIRPEDL